MPIVVSVMNESYFCMDYSFQIDLQLRISAVLQSPTSLRKSIYLLNMVLARDAWRITILDRFEIHFGDLEEYDVQDSGMERIETQDANCKSQLKYR